MNRHTPPPEAYIYCIDCETYCDQWKYDNLKDSGHEGHNIRHLQPDSEYDTVIEDCRQDGCIQEWNERKKLWRKTP